MAGSGLREDGGWGVCVVAEEEGESRCWMIVLFTAYLYCGVGGADSRREERMEFCFRCGNGGLRLADGRGCGGVLRREEVVGCGLTYDDVRVPGLCFGVDVGR